MNPMVSFLFFRILHLAIAEKTTRPELPGHGLVIESMSEMVDAQANMDVSLAA